MRESAVLRRVMLRASELGARLWRNTVGYDTERHIHYGLCRGSADLIGFVPVTITPAHVGRTVAVFMAIECKSPKGSLLEEQSNFLDFVSENGGIAIIARSADDLTGMAALASTAKNRL
jgi:hypothetical protein